MPGLAGDPARLASELSKLAHDLRSALSASTAYLDLVQEQVAEGGATPVDDLALLERSLGRIEVCVERLDLLRKEVSA